MRIFKDEALREKILQGIRERNAQRDPKEFHLGELVLCLNKAYFRRVYGQTELPTRVLILYTMGKAFQQYLTGSVDTEDSYRVDGIYMTPDWMEDAIPWEVKMTYQGSNGALSEHWLKQCMGYCKMRGDLVFAIPRVCVNGDWSWIYKRKDAPVNDEHPILTVDTIEFTQGEVDANWGWVKGRKVTLVKAIEKGKMPSLLVADYKGGADSDFQCVNCVEGGVNSCPEYTTRKKR